ncbi:ATPase [Anaerolentibacter hominis]|uniref:ATPase n=1 Tax=Anaerolentibacter hominis TaxID=3079009 RepID=UPI0031B85FD6
MGSSKIEELIEEIYEFIESCKMQPLSSTKVIVPKDDLYDLLDELRLRTPDEVKKFQKIIANRDAILTDAENKANAMLREAQDKMDQMVSEHEIMQEAYARADEIINQATEEAQGILQSANDDAAEIRDGAMAYTTDMLSSLESILTSALSDSKTYYSALIDALQSNLNTVTGNKQELAGSMPAQDPVEAIMNEGREEEQADNYDFKEDDFMKHID